MKKFILFVSCALAFVAILWQEPYAQINLRKAVISNGGSASLNGSTIGLFVVGQTAAGTASNGQTTGQFGFFNSAAASSAVSGSGAGAINSVRISPNPAANEVKATVTILSAGIVDLLIYDASGHLISTVYSGRKEAGTFTVEFNAAALSSGAYYLAARMPGALVQTKFDVVK
ncbi:MAG: T9SS type A sorting domain-containing protein [Bacteroidota bacterium]|nr:T9SS type A sorting domain-containing protein [Bacteroidota bacterium]MDP4229360.1 T9SS type A sorting domain-containing protein [Bacteroidota bacterium]MDP4236354.1 T9SS type A sorting domain-containing protein [Bacteroidota bacterium]